MRIARRTINTMPRISSLRLRLGASALTTLRRLAIRQRRSAPLAPHLEMGEQGELAALFYLRQNGYVVVARRWQSPKQRGDIDLVAWEGDTLCFIEVKTRASHAVATAESAVDEDKRTVLRRIARYYLKAIDPPPAAVRFDVVSVYPGTREQAITLYRSAFDW
jgi:putative endonuclease